MIRFSAVLAAASALFLGGTAHLMAQVAVPYSFSAGTPAKASEVNANFQALVGALNTAGATAIPEDGTYEGLQYSVANTLTGRNVVVMQGTDNLGGSFKRYAVRASYQNGSVLVNGVPTTFAYVRLLAFIKASNTDSLLGATVVIQGINDLNAREWNTEVNTYGTATDLTAAAFLNVTDTQTDDYLCFNAAVSGHVRHCRLITRDPGLPTRAVDDSRIVSLISIAFTAGPANLNFPNGGVEGSFFSESSARSWFLLARNIGIVAETRRHGVEADGDPNLVLYSVIYYRISGVNMGVGTGSLAGTMFANANNLVFFAP
jgi:hypothetical protein